MGIKARLAKNAEVISTIGVALAMVRDTIERNIVEPTPEDILAVRKEASESVIKIGAVPETVEVQVEVDTRRNIVRATAFGTTELRKDENTKKVVTLEDCKLSAVRSMHLLDASTVKLVAQTSSLMAFVAEKEIKTLFGLFKTKQKLLRVIDKMGVVRLKRNNILLESTDAENALILLEKIINDLTDFGDAGRTLPDIHLLVGARIISLSGLAETEQALVLAKTEIENLPNDAPIVIVAAIK